MMVGIFLKQVVFQRERKGHSKLGLNISYLVWCQLAIPSERGGAHGGGSALV